MLAVSCSIAECLRLFRGETDMQQLSCFSWTMIAGTSVDLAPKVVNTAMCSDQVF